MENAKGAEKSTKKILKIGNYAVARGAFEAGVTVASAYPGTPSTEITEFLAKYKEVNSEWSPNEKVALEVGIGASIAGARSIVSMKHVGLNVAADPLFTVSYTGVNGGLVIVTADDPGVHSSQNEQDSRYYAISAKIPMLEPSDSQDALEYTKLAFSLSEQYDTPVFIRMTTRVSHSQSYIKENPRENVPIKPYVKNPQKYVMMPGNAKMRRQVVEKRMIALQKDCNTMSINSIEFIDKSIGIVCAGSVYQYIKEALPKFSVFKLGIVNPLPLDAISDFSKQVKRLIVIEELDGVIENQLKAYGIKCEGKNLIPNAGELSVSKIKEYILGEKAPIAPDTMPRPPVLCPGCPHRSVFSVISKLKLTVMGDIGCYTLGVLPPLSSVDAVICMGASIGMTIGAEKAQGRDSAKKTLAVIGDSTFVHSGITGVIDAVYNNLNTKILIVDNATTGMTGHQPHPGTGKTITGESSTHTLDFVELVKACGVKNVVSFNALDLQSAERIIKAEMQKDGVSVMIAKEPCALINKTVRPISKITAQCKNCKACIKLGCPAIVNTKSNPFIDASLCVGCGVCKQVCKFNAIEESK